MNIIVEVSEEVKSSQYDRVQFLGLISHETAPKTGTGALPIRRSHLVEAPSVGRPTSWRWRCLECHSFIEAQFVPSNSQDVNPRVVEHLSNVTLLN